MAGSRPTCASGRRRLSWSRGRTRAAVRYGLGNRQMSGAASRHGSHPDPAAPCREGERACVASVGAKIDTHPARRPTPGWNRGNSVPSSDRNSPGRGRRPTVGRAFPSGRTLYVFVRTVGDDEPARGSTRGEPAPRDGLSGVIQPNTAPGDGAVSRARAAGTVRSSLQATTRARRAPPRGGDFTIKAGDRIRFIGGAAGAQLRTTGDGRWRSGSGGPRLTLHGARAELVPEVLAHLDIQLPEQRRGGGAAVLPESPRLCVM